MNTSENKNSQLPITPINSHEKQQLTLLPRAFTQGSHCSLVLNELNNIFNTKHVILFTYTNYKLLQNKETVKYDLTSEIKHKQKNAPSFSVLTSAL